MADEYTTVMKMKLADNTWETIKGYKVRNSDGSWTTILRATMNIVPRLITIPWNDLNDYYFAVNSNPEGTAYWDVNILETDGPITYSVVDPLVEPDYEDNIKIKFDNNNDSTLNLKSATFTSEGKEELRGFMAASTITQDLRPATIVEITPDTLSDLRWDSVEKHRFLIDCYPVQNDWDVLTNSSDTINLNFEKVNSTTLDVWFDKINNDYSDVLSYFRVADNRPGELTNTPIVYLTQSEKPKINIVESLNQTFRYDDNNYHRYTVNVTPDASDWEIEAFSNNSDAVKINDTTLDLKFNLVNTDTINQEYATCQIRTSGFNSGVSEIIQIFQKIKPTLTLSKYTETLDWDDVDTHLLDVSTNDGGWTIVNSSSNITIVENHTLNRINYSFNDRNLSTSSDWASITVRHTIDTSLERDVNLYQSKVVVELSLTATNTTFDWDDLTNKYFNININVGGWEITNTSLGINILGSTTGTVSGAVNYKLNAENHNIYNKTKNIIVKSVLDPSVSQTLSITQKAVVVDMTVNPTNFSVAWDDLSVLNSLVITNVGGWVASTTDSAFILIDDLNGATNENTQTHFRINNETLFDKDAAVTVTSDIDPSVKYVVSYTQQKPIINVSVSRSSDIVSWDTKSNTLSIVVTTISGDWVIKSKPTSINVSVNSSAHGGSFDVSVATDNLTLTNNTYVIIVASKIDSSKTATYTFIQEPITNSILSLSPTTLTHAYNDTSVKTVNVTSSPVQGNWSVIGFTPDSKVNIVETTSTYFKYNLNGNNYGTTAKNNQKITIKHTNGLNKETAIYTFSHEDMSNSLFFGYEDIDLDWDDNAYHDVPVACSPEANNWMVGTIDSFLEVTKVNSTTLRYKITSNNDQSDGVSSKIISIKTINGPIMSDALTLNHQPMFNTLSVNPTILTLDGIEPKQLSVTVTPKPSNWDVFCDDINLSVTKLNSTTVSVKFNSTNSTPSIKSTTFRIAIIRGVYATGQANIYFPVKQNVADTLDVAVPDNTITAWLADVGKTYTVTSTPVQNDWSVVGTGPNTTKISSTQVTHKYPIVQLGPSISSSTTFPYYNTSNFSLEKSTGLTVTKTIHRVIYESPARIFYTPTEKTNLVDLETQSLHFALPTGGTKDIFIYPYPYYDAWSETKISGPSEIGAKKISPNILRMSVPVNPTGPGPWTYRIKNTKDVSVYQDVVVSITNYIPDIPDIPQFNRLLIDLRVGTQPSGQVNISSGKSIDITFRGNLGTGIVVSKTMKISDYGYSQYVNQFVILYPDDFNFDHIFRVSNGNLLTVRDNLTQDDLTASGLSSFNNTVSLLYYGVYTNQGLAHLEYEYNLVIKFYPTA